jgi:hypothetical protein
VEKKSNTPIDIFLKVFFFRAVQTPENVEKKSNTPIDTSRCLSQWFAHSVCFENWRWQVRFLRAPYCFASRIEGGKLCFLTAPHFFTFFGGGKFDFYVRHIFLSSFPCSD